LRQCPSAGHQGLAASIQRAAADSLQVFTGFGENKWQVLTGSNTNIYQQVGSPCQPEILPPFAKFSGQNAYYC
jgi:hypothetical protein